MPCLNCGKENAAKGTRLHPVLDSVELLLSSAWVAEVRLEQREFVRDLIKTIQALKHPYVIPLETQLENLFMIANEVSLQIPCFKCQAVWYHEITRKIQVRYLLEKGKRKEAVWLWLRSEFWGKIWALRALPILLRKPHPVEPQTAL